MTQPRKHEMPYVNSYRDRHGKMRFYFRRKRQRQTLPNPSDERFAAAYQTALNQPQPGRAAPSQPTKPSKPVERIASAVERTYRSAKARAKKKHKAFELTMEDVAGIYTAAGGRCTLTGCAFRQSPKGKHHKSPFAPSLDRIDCRKGYTTDNVRLVCVAVNFAMGEWGEAVFADIVRGYLTKRLPNPESLP